MTLRIVFFSIIFFGLNSYAQKKLDTIPNLELKKLH